MGDGLAGRQRTRLAGKSLSEEEKEAAELWDEQVVEIFAEISELIESGPQNTMSLCRMGGMRPLIAILCFHENLSARKSANRLFA